MISEQNNQGQIKQNSSIIKYIKESMARLMTGVSILFGVNRLTELSSSSEGDTEDASSSESDSENIGQSEDYTETTSQSDDAEVKGPSIDPVKPLTRHGCYTIDRPPTPFPILSRSMQLSPLPSSVCDLESLLGEDNSSNGSEKTVYILHTTSTEEAPTAVQTPAVPATLGIMDLELPDLNPRLTKGPLCLALGPRIYPYPLAKTKGASDISSEADHEKIVKRFPNASEISHSTHWSDHSEREGYCPKPVIIYPPLTCTPQHILKPHMHYYHKVNPFNHYELELWVREHCICGAVPDGKFIFEE